MDCPIGRSLIYRLDRYNPCLVPFFEPKSILIVPSMILYNRDIRKCSMNARKHYERTDMHQIPSRARQSTRR